MTLPVPLTVTDADGGNARHTVGVHTVLIRADGMVLLGRRSATVDLSPDTWSVPGGNLEAGESAVHGAIREIAEEVGVTIGPDDLTFATLTHFVNDKLHGPALAIFFTTTEWTGTPEIMEPDKCSSLGWFALDNLPHPIVAYVAHALAHIRQGLATKALDTGFSTFGWQH